jgi:hypothetical protein
MNELQANIDRVRTTEMGIQRIRRNLNLDADDVVSWYKQKIAVADEITRKGKNWYVNAGNTVITVNAHSYTIITAKREKNGGNKNGV